MNQLARPSGLSALRWAGFTSPGAFSELAISFGSGRFSVDFFAGFISGDKRGDRVTFGIGSIRPSGSTEVCSVTTSTGVAAANSGRGSTSTTAFSAVSPPSGHNVSRTAGRQRTNNIESMAAINEPRISRFFIETLVPFVVNGELDTGDRAVLPR